MFGFVIEIIVPYILENICTSLLGDIFFRMRSLLKEWLCRSLSLGLPCWAMLFRHLAVLGSASFMSPHHCLTQVSLWLSLQPSSLYVSSLCVLGEASGFLPERWCACINSTHLCTSLILTFVSQSHLAASRVGPRLILVLSFKNPKVGRGQN